MRRDPGLYLEDILEALDSIEEYTRDMDPEGFLTDKKTRDAVVRNFEVIGEAVKNIPDHIKERHPEIDWADAARMRDKLSHEYFGVSYRIVWDTIKEDLPGLRPQIKKVLEKEK